MCKFSKKIRIVVLYFGEWPEWINLYLESCKYNSTIEWLFFTDCGEPKNKCKNVHYVHISLDNFKKMLAERLKIEINFIDPYKLCDFRPFYGKIFDDYLEGYDYWGWGDIDVIYGDIKKHFIEENIFEKDYEAISFHDNTMVSGSLAFIKNSFTMKVKPFGIIKWRDILSISEPSGSDEYFFPLILDKNKWHFKISYNTPSVKGDNFFWKLPWLTEEWPTEWYWKDGKLTNNVDGDREFLYFHFLVWKGGELAACHNGCQWEKLDKLVNLDFKDISKGFKINEKGFHRL